MPFPEGSCGYGFGFNPEGAVCTGGAGHGSHERRPLCPGGIAIVFSARAWSRWRLGVRVALVIDIVRVSTPWTAAGRVPPRAPLLRGGEHPRSSHRGW